MKRASWLSHSLWHSLLYPWNPLGARWPVTDAQNAHVQAPEPSLHRDTSLWQRRGGNGVW
ncbi:hypothetical protein GCM10011313_24420 [Mycetocola zhadangensis]|nr:hypothetical protein GCM10011313_24420 [Mycetocola zhadangensis]